MAQDLFPSYRALQSGMNGPQVRRRAQKLFGGTYKITEHTHINPGGRVFWLPKTIVQVSERDADHVVYPHGLLLLLASTFLSF